MTDIGPIDFILSRLVYREELELKLSDANKKVASQQESLQKKGSSDLIWVLKSNKIMQLHWQSDQMIKLEITRRVMI